MGKISTAGVPSATFGTGSSTPRHKHCVTDKSVRRSAQDDDFVGVSTKNTLNKLALMGRSPHDRFSVCLAEETVPVHASSDEQSSESIRNNSFSAQVPRRFMALPALPNMKLVSSQAGVTSRRSARCPNQFSALAAPVTPGPRARQGLHLQAASKPPMSTKPANQ
jgi:hypothetical protein